MNIHEFLNTTVFQLSNYKLKMSMLIGVASIIVFNYVLLFIVQVIINRRSSQDFYTRGRIASVFLLIKYMSWMISIAIIFSILKIDLTFLMAGSAAIMVGLGLGVQQIFKDIVSGIFILMEGTIKVKDVLMIDNRVGRVVDIKLRTTNIVTRDGTHIIVPNGRFITENVVNWSHQEKRARFGFNVRVAYNTNAELVSQLLFDTVNNHQDVISNSTLEPIQIRMLEFEENAVIYEIKFWTERIFNEDKIKSDLRFAIYNVFMENKIQFPFPQRDVHFKNNPPTS